MLQIDNQLKHNDCGVSVIKTIANLFKVNLPREYIEKNLILDAEGSRLSDIKRLLEQCSFKTHLQLLDLTTGHTEYYKSLTPFIIPLNTRIGVHFVVVSDIKGERFQILDPTEQAPYFFTVAELKKKAIYSKHQLDQVKGREQALNLCQQVLRQYHIDENKLEGNLTFDVLFNKITYFLYLVDNYGLKDEEAEKRCLEDILFNQDIAKVPKQFEVLKAYNEKITLRSPAILSVKVDQAEEFAQSIPQGKETNIYLTLFRQLKTQRNVWFLYLFVALFATTLTQLSIFINQYLIDHILIEKHISIIMIFMIGFGLFKIFEMASSIGKSWLGIKLSKLLDEHFLKTFDHNLNQFSLSYIHSFHRGDLTERLSDATRLKTFFLRYFITIMVDTIVAFYTLGILFYMSWKLSLLVLAVMVLFYAWFKYITPYIQQNERIRFSRKADFFSRMIEKLEGIQVLKSARYEKQFSLKTNRSIDDLLDIQVKTQKINLLNTLIPSLITIISLVIITGVLSYQSVNFDLFTTGQVITFLALAQRIFSSLRAILSENLTLQENQIILKRYLDFKEEPPITNNNGVKKFNIEKIEIKNGGFAYHPEQMILSSVNIEIERGSKIKIEGTNGSGKSTLSKILAFLYPLSTGQILINGEEQQHFDSEKLKEKALLVSNEDILFNDTIRYNVTFDENISDKQIMKLAKSLELAEFIQSKDQGLDFMISENGKNLSTGQRKKILLLRALLHKAEILILDEVLSGIDSQARNAVEKCLNEQKNRAMVLISHETISHIQFDKVYRIADGYLTQLS